MPHLAVVGQDCSTMPSFQSFLTSSLPVFDIDLSNASLTQVISIHGSMGAKKNGGFNRDKDLLSWVQKLEEEYDTSIETTRVNSQFYVLAVKRMFEQGFLPSTINEYLCKLRYILSWAVKYGCKVSSSYDEFTPVKFTSEHVALTPDEVSHIAHFRIDQYRDERGFKLRKDTIETLTRVRDMFVLQCNLGQRFSDMSRIDECFFDDARSVLKLTQKKTGNKAEVNLKSMTIDSHVTYSILKKYNYKFALYNKDISRFNCLLHRLLHMIGGDFDREVVVCTFKLYGEIHVITKKLYEAISSHTGRRTHITILAERGHKYTDIRRCSGHKSLKSFEGYLRGTHFDD